MRQGRPTQAPAARPYATWASAALHTCMRGNWGSAAAGKRRRPAPLVRQAEPSRCPSDLGDGTDATDGSRFLRRQLPLAVQHAPAAAALPPPMLGEMFDFAMPLHVVKKTSEKTDEHQHNRCSTHAQPAFERQAGRRNFAATASAASSCLAAACQCRLHHTALLMKTRFNKMVELAEWY